MGLSQYNPTLQSLISQKGSSTQNSFAYLSFFFSFCFCAGSAKVSQVKASTNSPKALIIEPSKELAEQTLNNIKEFKKNVDNPKLR